VKLHSPKFEKALRLKVRKAIKSSRNLKRDFRAANKFRRHYHIKVLARPCVSILLALLISQILEGTGETTPALAIINLWTFAFVAVYAQSFLSGRSGSSDLAALSFLPVGDSTIARWEMQKSIRPSLWLLFDLICGYSVFALHSSSAGLWLVLLPAALLTWAHVLALAALAAAYQPRFPFVLISSAFFLIGFVIFIARNAVAKVAVALLSFCSPSLNLILPTGWPVSAFEFFLAPEYWPFLILLFPIAVTLGTWKKSLARLRRNYRLAEPILPEAADLPPEAYAIEASGAQATPARIGATEIEQIIVSRKFLAVPAWHERSWMERWLWRLLDSRERVLAEFMFPDGLDLMSSWKRLFRNLLMTFAAASVTSLFFSAAVAAWVLAGGLFVTFCHAIALLSHSGTAFSKVWCSGVHIPLYAGYGVGFRELTRCLLKHSAVQLPFVALYSLTATGGVFFIAGWPFSLGVWTGLRVAGLLFMSRCFLLVFAFSSGTNDTSRLRIQSLVLLGGVVGVCLTFLALGAASLLVPNEGIAWSLWGGAAVCAGVFLWFYGAFYQANVFDLMNVPQPQ
jgi:hypothetical protein